MTGTHFCVVSTSVLHYFWAQTFINGDAMHALDSCDVLVVDGTDPCHLKVCNMWYLTLSWWTYGSSHSDVCSNAQVQHSKSHKPHTWIITFMKESHTWICVTWSHSHKHTHEWSLDFSSFQGVGQIPRFSLIHRHGHTCVTLATLVRCVASHIVTITPKIHSHTHTLRSGTSDLAEYMSVLHVEENAQSLNHATDLI